MAFELPGGIPNFTPQPMSGGPGPLDQYGKILQLKSLLGQQSLLPLQTQAMQQEVQGKTLANQQQQMQIDSQKKLMDAISSGAFNKYAGVETPDGSGFDGAGAYQDLVKRGVLPSMAGEQVNSLLTIAKNQAEISKTQGQAGEAQQNIRIKTLDQLASKLGSISDMPSSDAAKALASLKQDLVQNPNAYKGLSQMEMAHLYGADLEHLTSIEQLFGLESKIADFHKSKSEAGKAATEATVAQQNVIGPNGMSPEHQSIIKKDVETRREEQPLELALVQKRAQIEQKLAAAGNSEVTSVPTRMIPAAVSAAGKADQDFASAKSVSDRMAATMEAARKGNVVSYQIIPEEGTLQITTSQGVHRINKTEIDQYEGGGSLWQRMEGHFGKQLTGQSIPKSVLDDMADIQAIQVKGAAEKYHNSLAGINKRYGSTFSPVQMEDLNGNGGANAPVDPFTAFGGKKR